MGGRSGGEVCLSCLGPLLLDKKRGDRTGESSGSAAPIADRAVWAAKCPTAGCCELTGECCIEVIALRVGVVGPIMRRPGAEAVEILLGSKFCLVAGDGGERDED